MKNTINGYLKAQLAYLNTNPFLPTGTPNSWGTKEVKQEDGTTETVWYYYGKDGKALQGWQQLGGNWFYFTPSDGSMVTGIQKIDGNIYYLNINHDGSYGAMKTGWQKVDGKWYGFKGDGSAYLGWQLLNNHWYYFDTDEGYALTSWQKINDLL
jgi:glucan-binding YG repeat protein